MNEHHSDIHIYIYANSAKQIHLSFIVYCFAAIHKINSWPSNQSCFALQWRHNGHDSVSNHQPHDCLLNRLFRRRSKKTSKLRVTGLCVENSPGTGEFPAQMASDAENVSIWWRHHVKRLIHDFCSLCKQQTLYALLKSNPLCTGTGDGSCHCWMLIHRRGDLDIVTRSMVWVRWCGYEMSLLIYFCKTYSHISERFDNTLQKQLHHQKRFDSISQSQH